MFKHNKLVASMILASTSLVTQQIQAAGFSLNDQSATASGNALAGAAASNTDISYSYWNPALLTNETETTLYISGALIIPTMDVTVNSAKDPNGNDMTTTATDTDTGDVVDNTVIPSIYLAVPVGDDTVLGVSLNVPFGLSGDYDDGWAGRYHSAESSIQDIALAFSAAHRFTDWLSAGASFQVHSAEVQLDAETTDFAAGGSVNGDGYGSLKGDDIGFGYSVGFTLTPTNSTRIGVGYRSEVELVAEGNARYTNIGNTLAALGVDNAGLESENTLPSVLSFGLEQEITDKLTFGASAILTGWSSMQELRIEFEAGDDGITQPDSVLTFGFEDQWFYSVGLTYDYSDNLVLRTGYAIDYSPVTDQYRSARTPDGDRQWLAFGGTYQYSETTQIIASYSYILIEDVSVVRDGTLSEDASRGTLDADYESSAHVVSIALNTSF